MHRNAHDLRESFAVRLARVAVRSGHDSAADRKTSHRDEQRGAAAQAVSDADHGPHVHLIDSVLLVALLQFLQPSELSINVDRQPSGISLAATTAATASIHRRAVPPLSCIRLKSRSTVCDHLVQAVPHFTNRKRLVDARKENHGVRRRARYHCHAGALEVFLERLSLRQLFHEDV